MPSPFFLHRPDLDDFILIHTMGKVGSMALMRSLETVNVYCRHFHWVAAGTEAFFERFEQVSPTGASHWNYYVQNRLNIRRARSALQDPEYASVIKVITAIRAPIDQILSHYFQSFPAHEAMLKARGLEINAGNVRNSIHEGVELYMANPGRTIAELTRELTEHNSERIMFCWLVHNYLHWFDEEFSPFFGVDILAGKTHEGFQIAGNALILKFEALSTQGERAVASYAQRPRFSLIRQNVGARKAYAELYREVAGAIKFPADFVDHLCEAPYVRHFYSNDERRQMRQKWIAEIPARRAGI
jgi:hypothetical protein